MNAINSDGASGSPAVDTSYNPFLPYSETMSEKIRAQQGPRCANNDCGKPKWVPASEGGCTCPRWREDAGPDAARTFKAPELRRIEALEAQVEETKRLNQLIECYLKANGVDLPSQDAKTPSAPAVAPAAPAAKPADGARKAS